MTDGRRILLVSPVHNEAAHIERVVEGVAAQSLPPQSWIVIDDGSDDATAEIVRAFEPRLPFLKVVSAPREPSRGSHDRLARAAAPRAFNRGLAHADWQEFDYIGKLDGDIELPPDYLERLLDEFREDPSLGLAGGTLVERFGSEWRRLRIPYEHHVHGALRLYSRACFAALGGVDERLGWDTIDETYARMHGFRTRSFPAIVARHHRHWGSAQGRLRGRARHGECAYMTCYGPGWALLRALKMSTAKPVGLSGTAFLYGYGRAALRSAPRVEDREFRRFLRRELRGRLLAPLRLRRA
jgi:biofilm PGA synthesis N-glycosyltransferase PgaC